MVYAILFKALTRLFVWLYIFKPFCSFMHPVFIVLIHTHKNGDCGAISVTEQIKGAPRRSLKKSLHISGSMGLHTILDSGEFRGDAPPPPPYF